MLDLTKYVDPHQGIDNSGNTVIGPLRPNASSNPSPDTADGGHGGYLSGHPIRGFSQIHASGTGYGKYGEFLISPQIGLEHSMTGHDSPGTDEIATCYEYAVTLSRYGIRCSVTPTEHCAIYKFVYPESRDASLLLDMVHSVPLLCGITQRKDGLSVSDVVLRLDRDDAGNILISGSGTYYGGFGPKHRLHFFAVVKKTADSIGIFDGDGLHPDQTSLVRDWPRHPEEGMGGYLRFSTEENEAVYMKIAVSFTGVEKAKYWLDSEIPRWDYEAVREETRRLWNVELNKIHISRKNLSEEELQIFYTSFFHTMCMPRDRTDDIPGYSAGTPMIDDHYAAWDTWRTVYPLYTLIKPEFVAKTITSFSARLQLNGYARDSFVGGGEMYMEQGGADVDNIIADAYVKGVPGIDWEKAYQVMKNHADNYRLGWYVDEKPLPNPSAPYYQYGYIPDDCKIPGTDFGAMSCSYTLEQAYNDFCTATLARDLGTQRDYETYLGRSGNWRNLWNPDAVCGEFKGFINPRNADGSWVDYDPAKLCGSWVPHFYEATGYNYTFFVPHCVPELIEKCGGEESFIRRLIYGMEQNLVDYGNEPAFLAAYLAAHTAQPWVVTDMVQAVRHKFTLEGPPGNDDSGAMGSWYIFSSVGFFPNAGQDFYYLTSPHYDHTVIRLGNGKTLEIRAENLSEKNKYIQSVKINGVPHYCTMFKHELIANGGTIEFVMGSEKVDYSAEPQN